MSQKFIGFLLLWMAGDATEWRCETHDPLRKKLLDHPPCDSFGACKGSRRRKWTNCDGWSERAQNLLGITVWVGWDVGCLDTLAAITTIGHERTPPTTSSRLDTHVAHGCVGQNGSVGAVHLERCTQTLRFCSNGKQVCSLGFECLSRRDA